MADDRISKSDTDRAVQRMREAYERDPKRFAALKVLIDRYPDGYDPAETPEQRKQREEEE